MRLRNYILAAIAVSAMLVSCKKETQLESPSISIDPVSLEFTQNGEEKTITLTSNRDWVAVVPESAQSWLSLSPSEGSAGSPVTVTVKAEQNTDIKRSASIIFNASLTKATLNVSQAGVQITVTSIADFALKPENTTDWYYLEGTVTKIADTDYGNLTIQDATGSIDVRGVTSTRQTSGNDKSFSSLGIEVGDILTVGAIRSSYKGTAQAGSNDVPTFYVEHIKAADIPTEELSSIDAVFTTKDSKVSVKGQVIAVSNVSFVLNDGGEKNLLVYAGEKNELTVKVGDNIAVEGTVSTYGGLTQLTSPVISETTETFTPKTQTVVSLSGETLASYQQDNACFITVEAAVVVSGNYKNLYFDNGGGYGTVVSTSFDDQIVNGKILTLTGYYGGRNGIGYLSIIPTSVSECQNPHIFVLDAANPQKDISNMLVSSAANSFNVQVIANTSWTVTSEDGITADPASGSTSANPVKISYPENETDAERTLTVKVTAGEYEFPITLTQSAPYSGDAAFLKLTEALDDYTGKYLIVTDTHKKAFDGSRTSNFKGSSQDKNNKDVTITDGAIAATEETLALTVDIAKVETGYTIKMNSGYYLYLTGTDSGLNATDTYDPTTCINQIEYSEGQGFLIKAAGGNVLLFNDNSGSNYFRFYKSTNIGGSTYTVPSLYKYTE